MASGKTENYGLSQWEATDQVVRADFNADNEKIDAGLAENKAAAAAAQETADNLAAVAFTPENLPFVVGTYTGNGAESRVINLGFQPSAVFACRYDSKIQYNAQYYGGLAVVGHNVSAYTDRGVTSWDKTSSVLAVVENGFKVANYVNNSLYYYSNTSGTPYYYIALR